MVLSRRMRVTAVVLALALLATSPAWPLADARGASDVVNHLPTPRNAVSAVSAGDVVYMFGGWQDSQGGFGDQVVRFDPVANTVGVVGHLPSGRIWTSAVWTGSVTYVFGGATNWGVHSDQILRFDPATGSVEVMGAHLPGARSYTGAVWDGTYAYVLGGSNGLASYLDEIVRYDPATDTAKVVAHLPFGNDYFATVWDGHEALMFGGSRTAQVLTWAPGDAYAKVTLARFPAQTNGMSAAWDGQKAFVFGGFLLGLAAQPEIWVYRPGHAQLLLLHDAMPAPRANTAAAWGNGRAYVFGGSLLTSAQSLVDDVLAYRPSFELLVQAPRFVGWVRGVVPVATGGNLDDQTVQGTLSVDGTTLASAAGVPSATWDTRTVSDGAHALGLSSTAADGGTDTDATTVGVDNTPPRVAFSAPHGVAVGLTGGSAEAAGLRVAWGSVRVAVDATDPQPGSGVASVAMLVDGQPRATLASAPFTWTWDAGSEALGPHTVTARATDAVGNVASVDLRFDATLPTSPTGIERTLAALP